MLMNIVMTSLEAVAKYLYCRTLGIAARSEQPYATHIPVLVGVAAAFLPKRLVEFGSGDFSTLAFLDETAFPSLVQLSSYENNLSWVRHMETKLAGNPRVDLRFFEGRMRDAVSTANLAAADLIFVDDSPSGWERGHTLAAVAQSCRKRQLTIVHDYDLPGIRVACRKFEHRFPFTQFTPQSCAVWNGDQPSRGLLESVAHRLEEYAAHLSVTDARGWARIFCA